MTTNPPLPFPLATGRLIADTSEMDWTQYTYWIESNGPLVVISEQQKLVAYVAQPDVAVHVPEPSYVFGCVLGVLIIGVFLTVARQVRQHLVYLSLSVMMASLVGSLACIYRGSPEAAACFALVAILSIVMTEYMVR